VTSPASQPLPLPDGLDRVVASIDDLADSDDFSGVLRVEQGGCLVVEHAVGTASRRWAVPVHADMRFDVASVTKLFTSVAVLQQVEAGRLDLHAALAEYVDLAGTTISPDVTLWHLLTHTSGIADDADEEAGESYEALWVDRPSYRVTRTEDFLPGFVDKPANFAPGEGCRYCNVGFVLAGLALERVTGETYRDVVRRDVFARADMTGSGFFHMAEAEPDVAEGWEPVRRAKDAPVTGWRQNIYSYPPIGSPDGGAHTTAAELLLFLRAVRDGRLLGPEHTQAFLTPHVRYRTYDEPTASGAVAHHMGLGLEFQLDADDRVLSFWKEGVNAGSSAMLRHYPAHDVSIALVANSEDAIWGPVRQIQEWLLPLDDALRPWMTSP
jgi:CubicO group peptidase (beta-lactamase class C family)